jgi:glucan-binding YG repeat protein
MTFCKVCNSVVEWGEKIPAKGHEYEVVDGKLQCVNGGELYNGVYTDGKTYLDGVVVSGWVGKSYYKNGVKVTGVQVIDKVVYTFDENGIWQEKAVHSGFIRSDEGTMYFTNNTSYITGYASLDGYTAFYFDENGYAFTSGHKTVEEAGVTHHYYFLEDGKAYTGGRKEIDGDCYFFGSDGKALTAAWETIDGTLYYFQPDGRAAKDAFLTIDGSLYYFDGFSPVTGGWFCLGEYYYYADDQGKLATDTVVEGYVLDEQGRSSTKYRIVEIVKDLVDDSMTDQEKIDAVYYWILRNSMYYRSAYEHVKKDWVWEDSWVDDFATDLLDNWAGNCFRYAAFSGLCFREATGLPVVAYHGWTPGPGFNPIPHGWVTICQDGVWYVYDVELDKFRDYIFEVCYKEPAADSVIHIYGEGTNLY